VIVTGPGEVTVGREAGSDGTIRVLGFGSAVNVRPNSMIVGQQGKGTLGVESGGELQADKLIIGQSALDNRVTATGQDTILGVFNELVVGQSGRGTLFLQRGAQGIVKRLVVGRDSQADNRVSVEDAGTKLSGSGRIDIGERNGRGGFEMFNTAEARPTEGLSVGIYDGSNGTLLLDRNAFIVTPGDAIIGGGVSSQAKATMQGGGSLDALDVLIFAQSSGAATVEVTGLSSLGAARQVQIGFDRGAAGPTLLRAADGAFVSAGASCLWERMANLK
jgi:T5SS/PEP-CTERM-associated repeat protein